MRNHSIKMVIITGFMVAVGFGNNGLLSATEWAVSINNEGLPTIYYNDAPVVRARFIHWNARWDGGNPNFHSVSAGKGIFKISGGPERPKGIRWDGEVKIVSGKGLEYSFTITSDEKKFLNDNGYLSLGTLLSTCEVHDSPRASAAGQATFSLVASACMSRNMCLTPAGSCSSTLSMT